LKKWHATMRKKPKSYHDLQSRRFLKARSYNYETSMAMKCGLYTSCWFLVFALRGHGYGYWKNSGCTCRTKRQIEYWSFISNRIEKLR